MSAIKVIQKIYNTKFLCFLYAQILGKIASLMRFFFNTINGNLEVVYFLSHLIFILVIE